MPESDPKTLERRLEAVEHAVAEDEQALESESPATGPDEGLVERVETLESHVEELDAALQAVRGFLGGIDAVNESVEARAEAAVASVERLEHQLAKSGGETGVTCRDDGRPEPRIAVGESDSVPDSPDRSLGERLRDGW